MRNITVDHLADLGAAEVANLPPGVLADLQAEIKAREEVLKCQKSVLESGLQSKYLRQVETAFREEGRDSGTVTLVDDAHKVKVNVPKRVKWHARELAAICARIRDNGDDPAEYVKTELKVDERAYQAWPQAIRSVFEPARTVETGKPSFAIEELQS